MTRTVAHTGPTPRWILRARLHADELPLSMAPGGSVSGARERGEVQFWIETDGEWRLEIDDELIQPTPTESGTSWSWTPGFFAGEVFARLTNEDSAREAEYRIDVSPDPKKLGRDVFAEMLRTLWTDAPELLVGEEPARRPHGQDSELDDPLLLYGRLRRWGPTFLRALAAVAARPVTRLRRDRRRVPLHLVRRSDRKTALDLVRTGLLDEDGSSVAPAFRLLELVDTPTVEPTEDNPANRTMLALVQSVLQRVRACNAALARRVAGERNSETRTNLERRWPARERFLRQLELRLRRVRLAFPFADLPRAEVSPAGLTAISSNPVYARAHRTGWLCTRRGFAGADGVEDLWLPPTWEIYERWCWVTLRRQLEEDGFLECERAPGELPLNDAAWTAAHADGRRVTLLFQPKFSSWSIAHHRGARSLSGELRPDIVLLIDEGSSQRFVVYDAKYRTTRANVLDAMRSSHIYHDALRLDGMKPDRSLLLVPAADETPWLADPSFHDEHSVGLVVLAPLRNAAPTAPGALLAGPGT